MIILDMQFLWLYVDDLMGKGLEWYIILELLFYASANWVPVALPLSILLASIMAFGNLGENNELTAMKASGLSLRKIMKPLTILMVCISGFAFFFSNNLWPLATFKMQLLITDIQHTKAAIVLKEGVFYNEIDNFSIRVGEKDENGLDLHDLLIYDHSGTKLHTSYAQDPRDYKRIIRANKGRISQSEDKKQLQLTLSNGYILQEMDPKTVSDSKMPFMRYYFKEAELNIDLKSFELERSEEDVYENPEYLLNLHQIKILQDSTLIEINKRHEKVNKSIRNNFSMTREVKDTAAIFFKSTNASANYFSTLSKVEQKKNLHAAITNTKNSIRELDIDATRNDVSMRYMNKLSVEWHRKFTLAYACLMLFFIGAPLGAIVKKGGLGWPVLISILFFLIYFILSRAGDEMAISGSLTPFFGMWLSAFILTPIAIFIFYKANNDSKLFDMDFYQKFFRRIFGFRKK